MPAWMPDWNKMMDEAPEISVPPGEGYVYLIADSHLGDQRAPSSEFFKMLEELEQARMVVFMGDLYNTFNSDSAEAIDGERVDHPRFGEGAVWSIVQPRTLQLGVKFQF